MIHPREAKYPQHDIPLERVNAVKQLRLSLSQHTGSPARCMVSVKEAVRTGQLIGEAQGFISASLHAPSGGIISAINEYPHPVLKTHQAVSLTCDGQKSPHFTSQRDVSRLGRDEIIEAVKTAGIVGMGGASFPTHVKLSIPKGKRPDTLIINGCECEPYLSCDYRLMIEHTEEIIRGAELILRAVGAGRVLIGIEDNKPEAIKKFNLLIARKRPAVSGVKVVVLKSRYPQGGEKQLIFSLTRRKVPSGGLPFDAGCLVQNVATCFAVYEALVFGKPLIERPVTFAGGALDEPKNLWVKIGTTIQELFDTGVLSCKEEPVKILHGGPMMGIALESFTYPVLKGTSGILFLTEKEISQDKESACIRCGRCVASCPMRLLPLEYPKLIKASLFERLDEFFINDCIECGCCAWSCPANIPLVHYIKTGKQYLRRHPPLKTAGK